MLKQPEVKMKLPRDTRKHPLIDAVERIQKGTTASVRRVAIEHLGVTQQTLHEWLRVAAEDRDFAVPPLRVPDLCRLSGIAPYMFNPVLWPDKTWRFK